jgi:hypothetical protein
MSAPSGPRPSRRYFLKLGAAAAATLVLRLPEPALSCPTSSPLRIQSALPLPGYGYLPFPERLLGQPLDHIDTALVPAYVAAALIQRGLLQPVAGPAGRAHDPEGVYTVPYAYRVASLRYPDEMAAPKLASWADLWAAAGRSVWPASGRLITGAALLHRGYSPNDTHPGHLAQAGDDLARLRPWIVGEVSAPSKDIERSQNRLAFVLADMSQLGQANGLRLPVEGVPLIEYDWIIPARAAQAEAARQFIASLRPAVQPPRFDQPVRLIPLMPLPAAARAQHTEIWAALTEYQASSAA